MGIDKISTRECISSRGRSRRLANNGFRFPDKVESEEGDGKCGKVGGFKRKGWENDVVECDCIDCSQNIESGRLESDFCFGG